MMPVFAYQVRDKEGRKLKGVMESVSEKMAAQHLLDQGYLISAIQPAQPAGIMSSQFSFGLRISSDDLTMFYFQLANLVEAAIPLVKALGTVGEQMPNRTLRKIVADLVLRIQGGASLSEALALHSRWFPFLYRSMVRVGETSGNLAETLRYVAELNEARAELRYQIRSALAYPVVLMMASAAVVVFMMVWIVPTFMAIFQKSGIPMPLPTQLIFHLSMWIKANPGLIALTGIGGVFALRLSLRLRQVKYRWDRFWLSLPALGLLIRRVEVAHWARSLALMLSSGVPILQALEISKDLTQNLLIQEVLTQTYGEVQGGGRLADTLQKSGVFPNDVVQMVATGENSGTLDKMLYKIAGFYNQLVTRSLKKLTSMIEPFFILFMGIVIAFIMLAILLPIFDMIKLFSPT